MIKKLSFKSIYLKFAVIFLGIWWFFIAVTFGMVHSILTRSGINRSDMFQTDIFQEFVQVRYAIESTFLVSGLLGTVVLLLAVRSIVKPIRKLSRSAKEIANGNFDEAVPVVGNDEIAQLSHDFNQMMQGLKSIDELHKSFVSNVSHEFKTPITSIKGFARLIRDGSLSQDQITEYSGIIVDESERLSHLSSNLLRISELESHAITGHQSIYSLDEQIRKTILLLEVQWSAKAISFDLDLEPVRIKGEVHLLQEVWINLIQNAIKFSYPDGLIQISLKQVQDQALFTVRDFGAGISAADQERIFERFFKGDRSRSQEGSGLGLVIVKQILENSGGTVTFSSQPGEGALFTVTLPINGV